MKGTSDDGSPNDDNEQTLFTGSLLSLSFDNSTIHKNEIDLYPSTTILATRGGNSAFNRKEKLDTIFRGAKSTFKSSLLYWTDIFQSTKEVITSPFRMIQSSIQSFSPTMRSKKKQEEEEARVLHDLQTVILSEVSAPNTTTLPTDVLLSAAQRSGLLGGTLQPASVQECAKLLKQWYVKQGFVLNTMTGATLVPEKKAAVLSIQEPVVSNIPVGITFAKELVVDPETNQPMSYREYRQYHHRRKTNKEYILSREQMNTTIAETSGWTRPNAIAKVLQLQPGMYLYSLL